MYPSGVLLFCILTLCIVVFSTTSGASLTLEKALIRLDNSTISGLPLESWKPDPNLPITVASKPRHPEWLKGYEEFQRQRKQQEGHTQRSVESTEECSNDCKCANGGLTTAYGRYCSIFYSSCQEQIPCDGLDFCCSFHDYCVSILGYTSCRCNDFLSTCVTNIGVDIALGFETSSCQYEASTALTIASEAVLNPLCPTPKTEDYLANSYTLYVRWPPGNTNLIFDYTATPYVYADSIGLFPVGACEEVWDCSLWNSTKVRRHPYGRLLVQASDIVDAVHFPGYYELRYFIEQPHYKYWVATSNSFFVEKY